MAIVYGAIVENGTGIVKQMVPGDSTAGVTPGIPEPGETVYPVSEADAMAYRAWIASEPSEADYIRNPDGTFQVVEWPDIPAVIDKTSIVGNGVDMAIITGLPNPSTIIVQSIGIYIVIDGQLEITYDNPGIIQLSCESNGYKPKSFIITAN